MTSPPISFLTCVLPCPPSFLATFIGHLLYYSQGTQRRKSSYTKGAPFPAWVEMGKMGFRFLQ